MSPVYIFLVALVNVLVILEEVDDIIVASLTSDVEFEHPNIIIDAVELL
jgi:hypothetical protein